MSVTFGVPASIGFPSLDKELQEIKDASSALEEKIKSLKLVIAEQNNRKFLGFFGRILLSRYDTITPLIEASKALKYSSDRIAVLREGIAGNQMPGNKRKECQLELAQIEDEFKESRAVVVSAFQEKIENINGQWNRWNIVQWWSNMDEAVVTSATQQEFASQMVILESSGLTCDAVEARSGPFKSNALAIKNRKIQSDAAWNTGLKIASNIGVGALAFGGLIAVGMMTGDLDRMMRAINQSASSQMESLNQLISSLSRSIGSYTPSFSFH